MTERVGLLRDVRRDLTHALELLEAAGRNEEARRMMEAAVRELPAAIEGFRSEHT